MPAHIHNQGRIHVAAPAAVAFHFFTPKGEELWVDHWRPHYLFPPDGVTSQGMVFTTGEGAEFTIWQLLDFDPVACHSRYARTTPGSRTGTVVIDVHPLDDGHAAVDVQYEMTALTARGQAALAAFEDGPFRRMMDDWAARIGEHLPELLRVFGSAGPA